MRTFIVALAALLLTLPGTGRAETLYFIHVDHLGTPRLAIGEDGVERWRWDNLEPFGDNVPIETMGTEGYLINLPLRFPGQYADKETNLVYNYFRDYDPGIGRYVQSDLIGLYGGLNTYTYVDSAALMDSDPYGLAGTWKQYKWVNCPAKERQDCIEDCERQGRVMESCAVRRGRRHVVRNGVVVWELYTVPGSMSCLCKDCEKNVLQRILDTLTQPRPKYDPNPLDPSSASSSGRKPNDPFGAPPAGRLPGFGVP